MKKTQSEYVAGAERPLIVRLRNFVGEVVLSVPVLSQLKEIGYALHLVARHSWAVSLFSGFDATVHVQPSSLMARVRQLRELRTYCRSIDPEFDRRENALLQTDSFSSALEMWLAGLNGLGYAYDARSLMLARKLAMDRRGHVFEWYWRLGCGFWQQDLAIPKVIDLPVSDKKKVDAQSQLRELGMDAGHRFLMVCPFAATLAPNQFGVYHDKKWPGFMDFVARAPERLGLPVVIYPGPNESAVAYQLYPKAHIVGGADLGVCAALLQAATLVVSNDTGIGHLATAVGARLLSVMGPTVVSKWGPWGPNVTVLQRPQPTGAINPPVWPEVEEVLDSAYSLLKTVTPLTLNRQDCMRQRF